MLTILVTVVLLFSACYAQEHSCSREASRKVRSLLEKDLYPIMAIDPVKLPSTCPIHPDNDMYHEHEQHKFHDHGSDWQCTYCNKRFVSEKYLDRHLGRMHSHLIPKNATVCIGDYSKMFGFRAIVEPTNTQRPPHSGLYSRIKRTFGALEKCLTAEVKGLTDKCNQVAATCFPEEEQVIRFNKLVCGNLKCVNGVLKGGLYKGDEEDDVLTMRLVRMLCVGIIVLTIFMQVYLSNSILNQVLAGVRGPSTAVDHLHRHQNGRRDRKYGWFLNTILDAFDTAKLAVRRALKPSSKRQ